MIFGGGQASQAPFLPGCLGPQTLLGISVIVTPVKRLLKPPVPPQGRRSRPFHFPQGAKCRGHGMVFQQRPAPVLLEPEQRAGKFLHIGRPDKIACIILQDPRHIGAGIPPQRAPDGFVHIVIAPLGVSDEPNRSRLGCAENRGLIERARIDRFASLGQGIGPIPIRHRVLALPAVGNVGVMPDRVAKRNSPAQFGKADPHLRAKNHPGQPVWRVIVQNGNELVQPLLVETLRRDPELGLRMELLEQRGFPFEESQQNRRLSMTRIAPGDEDGVEPGQLLENFSPLL